MRKINKIKIFVNDNEISKEIYKELNGKLIKNNFEICEEKYDLAIAIGGDGSFLRMIKKTNFNSDIYYVGINTGTLGFLQEIKPNKIDEFINNLNKNNYKEDNIGILETNIITKNSSSKFYSLNEIVIRELDLNTVMLDIFIEKKYLETFNGDGILVSTSCGSSAYNLSFGGALIYNTLHTIQITPIAPLNSKAYRNLLTSIILPENKKINIYPKENKNNILITIDGENKKYKNVREIKTNIKNKRIKCLRMQDYNFINIINEKFLND
ncbi:MAG: NAD(+)/NADH kinase [Bacilli bacterium]|nr:NAD(+)/NADH kinase [Bacilli bacterium]